MGWPEETIGNCRLILGDCREVLATLEPMDALVTDPPYGVGLKGKHGHYRHEPNAYRRQSYCSYEDTPENFHTQVLPALRLALKHVTAAAVFMSARRLCDLPPMDDVGGFYLPNGCGMGRWGFQTFMHVAFYGRDPYRRRGSRPNGRYGLYGNDSNTIAHPCAKPVAAMIWAVTRASLPAMAVLDPFMGSGTTGVACMQTGRSFIGIEIEQQYFDIACRRLEEAARQPDLFMSMFQPPRQLSLGVR